MHNLFRSLFLYLMFAGTMFFADGASALATVDGGGSGDGTSGGSPTGSGDGPGSGDDALPSSGDGASGDEGDRSATGESRNDGADDTTDPNALIDSGDGRKIPAKYKELFEKDKDLRNTYFNYQALRKTFPGGVKEAVQLARDVEQLGGLEGVERLQGELDSYTADAKAFESGDPKWIESSFQENPDVSLKHFANALDYVADNHPEHYGYYMARVLMADLGENLAYREIYAKLNSIQNDPQAKQLAKQLADYVNDRSEKARKIPEKQIDPQQKKIDEAHQKLTQREQQVRNKTINAEAAPYLTRSIETSLGAAAKASQLDLAKIQKEQPNRWGRFLKDVRNAVHNEILNDGKWLDRYTAALNSNDTAKCVRMLNKRHDEAIKGTDDKAGVAATIFHEWFGPPKAGARSAASGSASRSASSSASSGASGARGGKETPTLVNSLPPAKEINYADPVTDKWNGIYRLKSGKLIQVKRP